MVNEHVKERVDRMVLFPSRPKPHYPSPPSPACASGFPAWGLTPPSSRDLEPLHHLWCSRSSWPHAADHQILYLPHSSLFPLLSHSIQVLSIAYLHWATGPASWSGLSSPFLSHFSLPLPWLVAWSNVLNHSFKQATHSLAPHSSVAPHQSLNLLTQYSGPFNTEPQPLIPVLSPTMSGSWPRVKGREEDACISS